MMGNVLIIAIGTIGHFKGTIGHFLTPCMSFHKSKASFKICLLLSDKRSFTYRVSLKKGTFLLFALILVLEVGFYFFICVLESEF